MYSDTLQMPLSYIYSPFHINAIDFALPLSGVIMKDI